MPNLCQRFGLGCGFFQDIRRHFPDSEMEFEHGGRCAATPSANLPVSADEFSVTISSQVEQQRVLTPVKFLGKRDERLRAPGRTISGAVNAYVKGLLFDDVGDVEGQKEYAAGGAADVQGGAITFRCSNGFLRNQKRIDCRSRGHGERIVAKADGCLRSKD
jgi:hypothetical protein